MKHLIWEFLKFGGVVALLRLALWIVGKWVKSWRDL